MKITEKRLRTLIKEEVSAVIAERMASGQPLVKRGGRHEKIPGYHYDRIHGVHVRDDYNPRSDYGDELDKAIAALNEAGSYMQDALEGPYHGKVSTGGTTYDGRRVISRDRSWLEFVPKGAPSITPEDMFRAVTLLDLSEPGVKENIQAAIERGRNAARAGQIGDLNQYDIYSVYATTTG